MSKAIQKFLDQLPVTPVEKPAEGLKTQPNKERRNPLLKRVRQGHRRVTAYNEPVALEICERLAGGETLRVICADDDMPTQATFHRWVEQEPRCARAYAAARQLSAFSLEDENLEIVEALVRKGMEGELSPALVRAVDLFTQQRRWSASRRNPKAFGDKTITNVVPVNIYTTLDLGQDGVKTVENAENVYHVKAELPALPPPERSAFEQMQDDTGPMAPPETSADGGRKRKGQNRSRSDMPSATAMAEARRKWKEKQEQDDEGS